VRRGEQRAGGRQACAAAAPGRRDGRRLAAPAVRAVTHDARAPSCAASTPTPRAAAEGPAATLPADDTHRRRHRRRAATNGRRAGGGRAPRTALRLQLPQRDRLAHPHRPARARELLVGFADLSRATDRPADAPAPWGTSSPSSRDYLALEQARFGKRLRVEIDVDPGAHDRPAGAPAPSSPAVRDAVQRDIEPRAQGWGALVTGPAPPARAASSP
jgi:hypothetical protein